jgi:hypothetical protein
MTEKHPRRREIETRTRKIREHLEKAHASTDAPGELRHVLANVSAEIQILLREIEEIAATMG